MSLSLASGYAAANIGRKIASGDDPGLVDAVFLVGATAGIGGIGSTAGPETSGQGVDARRRMVVAGRALGSDMVVVEPAKIVSTSRGTSPEGVASQTQVTKELLVDARYAGFGNLQDACAAIRNGDVPELSTVLRGILDILDAATLTLLRPYLLEYKAGAHAKEHWKVLVFEELETESANGMRRIGVSASTPRFHPDGKPRVEETGSSEKTGWITEKVHFVRRQTGTATETHAVVHQTTRTEYLLEPGVLPKGVAGSELQRVMASMRPDYCGTDAVVESLETTRTREKVEVGDYRQHQILGWQLGGLLGRNYGDSMVAEREFETQTARTQRISGVDLAELHRRGGAILPGDLQAMGAQTVSEDVAQVPLQRTSHVQAGEFKEGLGTYAPFVGGIAVLCAKPSLGAKVAASDWFWAGVDVVEIGVAVFTFGGSEIYAAPAKAGAKAGAKTAIRVGAKSAAKEAAEQGVEAATKATSKGIGKTAGRTALREGAEQAADAAARKAGKETAEAAGERVAKTGLSRGPVAEAPNAAARGGGRAHSVPIETPNSHLAGSVHPQTGVPLETDSVRLKGGVVKEGVFPKFEPAFETRIGPEVYQATDFEQFARCNKDLAKRLDASPGMRGKFNGEQLAQIREGLTPDGYTWHHHQQPGRMQLVPTEQHLGTGHVGGRSLWGGGREARY